jgi:hypothetical protein
MYRVGISVKLVSRGCARLGFFFAAGPDRRDILASASGAPLKPEKQEITMKPNTFLLVTGNLLCLALTASATTRYVDLSSPAPAAPFTNWLSAATNIQDAVDAAVAGDEVLVTNGLYQAGTRTVYDMSNRVAVTKALTLRSVNGPAATSIVGRRDNVGYNGPAAVRCVYLTNDALLSGFTLTNGATQLSGDLDKNQSGGGVWCESITAVVSNCLLTGNSAGHYGGGAHRATLNNCLVASNSAMHFGGGYSVVVTNAAGGTITSFGTGMAGILPER